MSTPDYLEVGIDEDVATSAEAARAKADLTLARAFTDALADETRPLEERRAIATALNRINEGRRQEGRVPISDTSGLAAEVVDRLDERSRLVGVPGGSWLRDTPATIPSLWGEGDQIAWAEQGAAMIYGSDGAGKGVLAQNLALRLVGIIPGDFLGLPVATRERVVYLAQDRPAQIRRSFRRMVGELDFENLDDRLRIVWEPLPKLIDDDDDQLVRIAETNEADVLVVDSVKDVMANPSDEVSALAMRRAYTKALAAGVDVLLLHHDRKAGTQTNRKTLTLSDVYGSRFLYGGCDTIFAINGGSGDPVVDFRHLKLPSGEVGPFRIIYDFATGGAEIHQGTDLLSVLRASKGLTALDAARVLYETDRPSRAEKERARRHLDSLETKGLATKRPGSGGEPTRYYATDSRLEGV